MNKLTYQYVKHMNPQTYEYVENCYKHMNILDFNLSIEQNDVISLFSSSFIWNIYLKRNS